jgi:tRNA G18 (ribose-2'-O)-methylase SpoU
VIPPGSTPLEIRDPADPRIADYANLTDAQLLARALNPDRPESGLFMAEGELVVRQLIASPMRVHSVLLTPTRVRTMRDALEQLPQDVPVFVASQEVIDRITGFHIHRGTLAAGVRPSPPDLDHLLASVRTLVVLEDLANHDNVGGIFRAAAALAGVPDLRSQADPGSPSGAAVLCSPRTCDPLYRKAIRVSLGAALHMPFRRLEPWPDALGRIRRAGFTLIALTPGPEALSISELNPNKIARPAILLGSEGAGLSSAAFAAADVKVRIPIRRPMDSLNVVVAAGIALHCLAGGQKD